MAESICLHVQLLATESGRRASLCLPHVDAMYLGKLLGFGQMNAQKRPAFCVQAGKLGELKAEERGRAERL